MKRTAILVLASTILLAIGAAGLASASVRRERLQLRRTSIGTILVNGHGFTAYAFTRDGRDRDVCQQLRGCLGAWPAITTTASPIAGAGVRSSLIGTVTIRGGARQVTYAGHPLYTYAGGSGPGQTSYVNVLASGGRWPALNASGGEVR